MHVNMLKSHRQRELSSALALFPVSCACDSIRRGQLSGRDDYVEEEHHICFTCLFQASDAPRDFLFIYFLAVASRCLHVHRAEGQIYMKLLQLNKPLQIQPLTPHLLPWWRQRNARSESLHGFTRIYNTDGQKTETSSVWTKSQTVALDFKECYNEKR